MVPVFLMAELFCVLYYFMEFLVITIPKKMLQIWLTYLERQGMSQYLVSTGESAV